MTQLELFETAADMADILPHRNDVRKGDAAEAYVRAKLLNWDFCAHDALRDLPYDVVVDFGGTVCRIQVKCRSHAVNGRWYFRAMRGNWRSATGTYAYAPGDYDVAAFVALSLEKVLFLPGVLSQATFRTEDFLRENAERRSWIEALHVFTAMAA